MSLRSEDGLVKLWDVQSPEDPVFLCDLEGHSGPVHQVAWAPVGTGAGALLLSGGSDGRVKASNCFARSQPSLFIGKYQTASWGSSFL